MYPALCLQSSVTLRIIGDTVAMTLQSAGEAVVLTLNSVELAIVVVFRNSWTAKRLGEKAKSVIRKDWGAKLIGWQYLVALVVVNVAGGGSNYYSHPSNKDWETGELTSGAKDRECLSGS